MATQVKICGIKTQAALDAALDAGADYVGLVFFEKSPRNVDLATASRLAARARARGVAKVVALLVDADDAAIASIVAGVAPDLLQLHGAETPARVAEIRARFDVPVMKAVAVREAADVAGAEAYLAPGTADLILFDAKPPPGGSTIPGGNGLAFDWQLLAPVKGGAPFALAGGLTPDNVAAAAALTGAAIVDVSSGVESRPGEKDAGLIRRFLQAAKAAREA